MLSQLIQIRFSIDRRVSEMISARGDWPCRRGCDSCCRHLHALLPMTEVEWLEARSAMLALSPELQQAISDRVNALRRDASRPICCPFLQDGACSIYEARPIACRTYGFYVEREEGLYCDIIASMDCSDVVWGNVRGVDEQMRAFGKTRDLLEWMG